MNTFPASFRPMRRLRRLAGFAIVLCGSLALVERALASWA
jgi:hypothetical protein